MNCNIPKNRYTFIKNYYNRHKLIINILIKPIKNNDVSTQNSLKGTDSSVKICDICVILNNNKNSKT